MTSHMVDIFAMQVYGILGLQLTLTAVVATVIMTVQGARDFLLATPGVWIGLLVLTLLSECRVMHAGDNL